MCRIRRKQFSSIYNTTLVEKFAIMRNLTFIDKRKACLVTAVFISLFSSAFFLDNLNFPQLSNTGFPRFFFKILISRIFFKYWFPALFLENLDFPHFSNTGFPRFFSHLHWLAAGGEGYSVRLSSLGWSRCAVSRVNCSTWAARYSGNGFSAVSLNSNRIWWSGWRAVHKKPKARHRDDRGFFRPSNMTFS